MTPAQRKIKRWREDPVTFVQECLGAEPDAWQVDILRAFNGNKRLAMKAAKGCGKAQPMSLFIYTPDGKRRWGDLKPGDRVFAENGMPTKIVAIDPKGELPVFEVGFDDGSSTICSGDHLWRVRGYTERKHFNLKNSAKYTTSYQRRRKSQGHPDTPDDGYSVISTSEIIKRGVRIKNGRWAGRQFEIPRQKAVKFKSLKKRDLKLDPYLLGIWLGDGSKLQQSYTSMDLEIANEIVRRGYSVRVIPPTGENGKASRVVVHEKIVRVRKRKNTSVGARLRLLGVFGLSSHERFIPEIHKISSIKQRKDLLAGLLDSDGFISKDAPRIQFSSTSKQLAEDVIWLVRSLGGNAYICKQKPGCYRGKDGNKIICRMSYTVNVSTPFNPFFLPRKRARWRRPQERYFTRYIDSIKPAGSAEVMCIQVASPSQCYLTNDFIVTHNSTILSWIAWLFLVTRPHPKIAATSISGDNLADGLWTEMAKWHGRSDFLRQAFTWTKTRIFATDHSATWWMSARTWPRGADQTQQANTLAGLHAEHLLFIIDEVGGIPDAVMAAAEAGLSTGHDTKIIMAGNPTHLEGPLYRACTSERDMWYLAEITGNPEDPKRAPRIDIDWAREQIAKYGSNNPWVLINVFGQFPPSSINSLLGPDDITAAMNRHLNEDSYRNSQLRIGVDVARFGSDSTVLFARQGLKSFEPVVMRNANTLDIAARVMSEKARLNSDMEFIDGTGGFGGGVIDQLISAGYSPIDVQFAGKAMDPRYFNKRAEMWFLMSAWIKRGGSLPNIPALQKELTVPTYTIKNGKFLIEGKDQIKDRLGFSPDHADALCCTFATVEMNKQTLFEQLSGSGMKSDYDPFAD